MAAALRRLALLDDLRRHRPADDREHVHWRRMLRFAAASPDPFDRNDPERHFTGSAVVVGPDLDRVLLMHHRALDMWVQFGGHAEPGDASPMAVAIREAREESGLQGLRPVPTPTPVLDLDIHLIPRRGDAAAHEHYDVRYLFVAPPEAPVTPQAQEVNTIRWLTFPQAEGLGLDPSLLRVLGKVRAIAGSRNRAEPPISGSGAKGETR